MGECVEIRELTVELAKKVLGPTLFMEWKEDRYQNV